jgi:hypothetical protein
MAHKRLKQAQDLPKNKIRVARKRKRIVQLAVKGKTIREMSEALTAEGYTGTSRAQVHRDLVFLAKTSSQNVEEAREEAHDELRQLKKMIATAEQLTFGEKVDKHLAVHDRLSRLLGMDAPTKSVSASINANAGTPSEAFEFLRHAHGLSEEQLAETYAFMDELPRKPLVIDASYFPEPEQPGGKEPM